MSFLLLLSIAVLTGTALGSLVVLARSGESRVVALTALLLALAGQQGLWLWLHWGDPIALDAATGVAAAGLLAAGLGVFAVLAYARTLRELDRAEMLHWESMEGVRGLRELAERHDVELEDRLPLLLEMACERLGLEIGLVSRIRGQRYEVLAIQAPDDFPVSPGAAFTLSETYCGKTLESEQPVAIARAADSHWAEHPARAAFRFEAYLGAPIRVAGRPVGTLVFASLEPRDGRFTGTHKDLLVLMAQWIGFEFERREATGHGERSEPGTSAPRPSAPLPSAPTQPRVLHLNATVRRLEKRIRRLAGPKVEVSLELAPDVADPRPLRVPLDSVVLSLAEKAVQAMPDGGTLVVATANHEPAPGAPGVLPAVAPDRYATLTVSESGGEVDADALARIFDRDARTGDAAGADGRLPLPALYRMLQREGADLSVDAEPGRGSRFTVFMPIEQAPQRPAPPARASTPPPPPAG